MECQILTGHHAFSCKLNEVISEKPKDMSKVTPSDGTYSYSKLYG